MICSKCDSEVTSIFHSRDGEDLCKQCNNRRRVDSGEEGFFRCSVCGDLDNPNDWIGNHDMGGLCFDCNFWTDNLRQYKNGEKVVVDGHCYHVGDGREGKGFRGFAEFILSIRT